MSKWKIFSACFFLVLGTVLVYLSTQNASSERNWTLDQQVLPTTEIDGDLVHIKNIRNFVYESTATYTPQYYDKTFNLSELSTIDYIVEPFGSIGAAHTFLSFGFDDGSQIAISVEIRKEVGESFSPWKGVLRQYELVYVVADERDVVKLRTNYRKDDVYLYPVTTTKEHMRILFIDMLTRVNTLAQKPEFYNTVTNNCTTNIAQHINTITPNRISWDYRLLFPENSDVLAQELGLIAKGMTIEEARAKYRVNEKAEQYAEDPEFSKKIRE